MSPEEHLAAALAGLGYRDDPEMVETPRLVAGLLREFVPRAEAPALSVLPTRSHDLVVLQDLPFHSLCAHHLLPFFGTATVAFRPDGQITGLGALVRLVDHLSRRPQLQERLASEIANALLVLQPAAIGVRLVARQMCVEMRGARAPGTFTVLARRGDADADLDAALRG